MIRMSDRFNRITQHLLESSSYFKLITLLPISYITGDYLVDPRASDSIRDVVINDLLISYEQYVAAGYKDAEASAFFYQPDPNTGLFNDGIDPRYAIVSHIVLSSANSIFHKIPDSGKFNLHKIAITPLEELKWVQWIDYLTLPLDHKTHPSIKFDVAAIYRKRKLMQTTTPETQDTFNDLLD